MPQTSSTTAGQTGTPADYAEQVTESAPGKLTEQGEPADSPPARHRALHVGCLAHLHTDCRNIKQPLWTASLSHTRDSVGLYALDTRRGGGEHRGRTAGRAGRSCWCAAPACRPDSPGAGTPGTPARTLHTPTAAHRLPHGGQMLATWVRKRRATATTAMCKAWSAESKWTCEKDLLERLFSGGAPSMLGKYAQDTRYAATRPKTPVSVIKLGASQRGKSSVHPVCSHPPANCPLTA